MSDLKNMAGIQPELRRYMEEHKSEAIADLTAAPTAEDINKILAALRLAGIIAE